MSNCVVGSGGSRLPRGIIAEHGVEGSDHFSHDGDDDDLGFLVGVGETIGEGPEGGIVSACAEGRHVEDITDRHPTTVDTAVSSELATIEIVWCETDEGGDLLAAHLPEFRQQGDEREGQHRADAWHQGQQLIELSESSIGGEPVFYRRVRCNRSRKFVRLQRERPNWIACFNGIEAAASL